ncbi:MAG: hypothetical protein M0P01_05435 [Treponema sp.]|nr:hypothetical protein [Treponema sp.]
MIVFIPHPAEALLLNKVQKKILMSLNRERTNWYPVFPLWAVPDENDADMDASNARSTISALIIAAPEISENRIYFPVEINIKNGNTIKGKIYAGKRRTAAPSPRDISADSDLQTTFPITCRIFRAADAEFKSVSENDSEWKVLKSFWIKTK